MMYFLPLILLFANIAIANAESVVVSKEYINMNINNNATGFSIIGHVDNNDKDIIIIIKSDEREYDVKAKEKNQIGFYRDKPLAKIKFPKYINIATTNLELLERTDILDKINLQNLHETKKEIINYLVDTKQIEVYYGSLIYKNSDIFRYKFNFSDKIPMGSYNVDVYFVENDEVSHVFHDNVDVKKNKYISYIEDIKKNNRYIYAIYLISIAFILSGITQFLIVMINNIFKQK